MYNGYRFGGAVDIYNPYSIVCCMATLSIDTFWVQSGITSLIHRICQREDILEVVNKATSTPPCLVMEN